eukprot:CAMPEP_0194212598 /NCGR_PEP_ID=MMETSP0156-20130528/12656_1 /TAXON_ID=33649 /ORGANISM="Thalassionema nitzschioides, Strain L26-B" /LENGTH=294 /DNA_ID=CAMNT_0038940467 /DNA_START=95 /DNA_END=979 /DNA_ORIENTATION=-
MHIAIRDAAAVAITSIEKKLTAISTAHETVHLTYQLTELQGYALRSKLGFLDALRKMDQDEKLQTLFTLFDKNGSGSIDRTELAQSLKKIDQRKFSEHFDAAIKFIRDSEKNDKAMDMVGFNALLEYLSASLKCSFDDLAQFLTLRVALRDSGSAVLDDAIVELVQNAANTVPSVEEFNDAVVEVRMMLLFQMMAAGGENVSFEMIVKSLYNITETMGEIPRRALLSCADGGEDQVLDYPQFSSLLLNVVAAGGLNFHDVANSMTHTFCRENFVQKDMMSFFRSLSTKQVSVAR